MLCLDHLQLVETELVSGNGRELGIGRMGGPSEDGAEAARRLGSLAHIELQFIEPLLIEGQHALAAVDLEADEVLAAPGGTAGEERAGDPRFEANDGMGDVLILDLAPLTRAGHRTLPDPGFTFLGA